MVKTRRIALAALALALAAAASASAEAPLSPILASIDTSAEADQFWRERAEAGGALVEAAPGQPDHMLVTFVWRDEPGTAPHNIAISGGFLLDLDKTVDPLERLSQTDILWRSYVLPSDARFSYYFTAPRARQAATNSVWTDTDDNGVTREYFADPLSRRTYIEQSLDGSNHRISWLEGPDAPPESTMAALRSTGRLYNYSIESAALRENRPISVYVPNAARAVEAPGLLLLFDRENYLSAVPTPAMLDRLIAEGRIPPMIAVFVSQIDEAHRDRDLPPNPGFQAFLADEIIPFVRAHHPFSSDPSRNVVAGSSYGGLAATYTGLMHPEIFGAVVSQSGSFWWDPQCCGPDADNDELVSADAGWLVEQYAAQPRRNLRLYLNVGRWEGAGMLLPNRMMRNVLTAKGYTFHYEEYSGGHDLIQWRATLPRGLEYALGRR